MMSQGMQIYVIIEFFANTPKHHLAGVITYEAALIPTHSEN